MAYEPRIGEGLHRGVQTVNWAFQHFSSQCALYGLRALESLPEDVFSTTQINELVSLTSKDFPSNKPSTFNE